MYLVETHKKGWRLVYKVENSGLVYKRNYSYCNYNPSVHVWNWETLDFVMRVKFSSDDREFNILTEEELFLELI